MAQEPIVQRRHVSTNDERKSVRLNMFTSVQFINVRQDSRFVAIDQEDVAAAECKPLLFQKPRPSVLTNKPKLYRPNGEKTFDGADIYNVMY